MKKKQRKIESNKNIPPEIWYFQSNVSENVGLCLYEATFSGYMVTDVTFYRRNSVQLYDKLLFCLHQINVIFLVFAKWRQQTKGACKRTDVITSVNMFYRASDIPQMHSSPDVIYNYTNYHLNICGNKHISNSFHTLQLLLKA